MIQQNHATFTETEHEVSQKVADFTCRDLEVAYDYTIRDPEELQSAFNYKQQKYGNIYFNKPINPIVVSYGMTIHQESLRFLLELNKFNALIPMLASRLIAGHRQRLISYGEARTKVTTKNILFFETKAQTAPPKSYTAIQQQVLLEN